MRNLLATNVFLISSSLCSCCRCSCMGGDSSKRYQMSCWSCSYGRRWLTVLSSSKRRGKCYCSVVNLYSSILYDFQVTARVPKMLLYYGCILIDWYSLLMYKSTPFLEETKKKKNTSKFIGARCDRSILSF